LVGIIAGVSAGAVAVLQHALQVVFFFTARQWWRVELYEKQGELSPVGQRLVPRMFTNKELRKTTKSFSRSELLGSGGFGAVYSAISSFFPPLSDHNPGNHFSSSGFSET
jgi:hypothetical protein